MSVPVIPGILKLMGSVRSVPTLTPEILMEHASVWVTGFEYTSHKRTVLAYPYGPPRRTTTTA